MTAFHGGQHLPKNVENPGHGMPDRGRVRRVHVALQQRALYRRMLLIRLLVNFKIGQRARVVGLVKLLQAGDLRFRHLRNLALVGV